MIGFDEYVKYTTGPRNPIFSETLVANSVATAGGQAIKIDYGKLGAVYVLVHYVNIDIPATVAASMLTITDKIGRVIFNMSETVQNSGQYALPYLIETRELIMIGNLANVRFSVVHQYIRASDSKK